jgi:uncharacterized protein (TIGR03067 family)
MKKITLIPLCMAALFVAGCSTPSKSNAVDPSSESPAPPKAKVNSTVFEGTWIGHETTPGQEGQVSLTITGQTVEFHGASANDWLKGTFTLRDDANPKQFTGVVTDCGAPEYIGKTCYAIYKIEDGTLTVAGYEPGAAGFPSAFDAPGTRQMVFKHNP